MERVHLQSVIGQKNQQMDDDNQRRHEKKQSKRAYLLM